MKMRFATIFRESWRQMKRRFWFLTLLFLGIAVFSMVLGIKGDDILSLEGVASLLISPVIYYIVARVSLSVAKDENIRFKDIFEHINFNIYVSFFLIGLIGTIGVLVLVGIGIILSALHPIIGGAIFLVLLFSAIIYFAGVIFFAYYRLLDRRSRFWPSLKESFRLVDGHRFFLFKFMIIASALNIAGSLIFGIGLLITVPLTAIALAHIYKKLIIIKHS